MGLKTLFGKQEKENLTITVKGPLWGSIYLFILILIIRLNCQNGYDRRQKISRKGNYLL